VRGFFDNFDIWLHHNYDTRTATALNRWEGCVFPQTEGRCGPQCGQRADGSDCATSHHRSASRAIRVNQSNRIVLRFVGYRLCLFNSGVHTQPHGVALVSTNRDTVITTLSTGTSSHYRILAHEIAHLYGAPDHSTASPCTPGQVCVMRAGDVTQNRWCNRCVAIIMSNRNRH